MWHEFLHSNSTGYRLARTIVQGILGVLVSNLDLIITELSIDPVFKPAITALVMAILSPIMSELGKDKTELK